MSSPPFKLLYVATSRYTTTCIHKCTCWKGRKDQNLDCASLVHYCPSTIGVGIIDDFNMYLSTEQVNTIDRYTYIYWCEDMTSHVMEHCGMPQRPQRQVEGNLYAQQISWHQDLHMHWFRIAKNLESLYTVILFELHGIEWITSD